jgi:hypothetical protein
MKRSSAMLAMPVFAAATLVAAQPATVMVLRRDG